MALNVEHVAESFGAPRPYDRVIPQFVHFCWKTSHEQMLIVSMFPALERFGHADDECWSQFR